MSDTSLLEDSLCLQVQELYSGEYLLLQAMPRFMMNANDTGLNATLVQHFEEIELHRERLEEVARYLESTLSCKTVSFIESIIADTETRMQVEIYEALDMTIIAGIEKINVHLIGLYESAAKLAQQLGFHFAAELLYETLQEKSETVFNLGQFDSIINNGLRATA